MLHQALDPMSKTYPLEFASLFFEEEKEEEVEEIETMKEKQRDIARKLIEHIREKTYNTNRESQIKKPNANYGVSDNL